MNAKAMNKKKASTKVLMIAPQPFYEDRGTPIVILEELKIFSKLGYQVDLATYPIGSDISLPGVNITRTANPLRFESVAVGFSVRKLIMDLLLLLTALRLSSRNHYDCIHGIEEGAAIALMCKAICGIPIIYDMHSSLPDQLRKSIFFRSMKGQKFAKGFEKLLLDRADAVISSAGLANHVLTKIPDKAVWECYFPVVNSSEHIQSFSRKIGTNGRPTVVYAGNFSSYQGLDLLIEAAAIIRLEMPDILFMLIGGSEFDTKPISHLVEKHNLDGNIQLHPRIPRSEVVNYLSIADALVLPRRHGHNTPLKLFEYMTSNKPIVATEIPAHTALLNSQSAVLVKPTAEALARGLIRVIQDTQFASCLAGGASRAAKHIEKKSLEETLNECYRFAIRKINSREIS